MREERRAKRQTKSVEFTPVQQLLVHISLPETVRGGQQIKLPAGDMVIYPASSLHHVQPVTRGMRLAAIFWIQSLGAEK